MNAFCQHAVGGVGYVGAFVPGKDIRIPETAHAFFSTKQEGMPLPEGCNPGWLNATGRAATQLYWEGSVRRDRKSPGGRVSPFTHNMRMEVVDRFRGRAGFALRDSTYDPSWPGGGGGPPSGGQARTPDVAWTLSGAQFCLATDGGGGGFGSRDLEALAMGCVPAYVNDNTSRYYEEVIRPEIFSVTIPEAAVAALPEALDAAAPRLEALQRAAHCTCEAVIAPWRANTRLWHETMAEQDALGARGNSSALSAMDDEFGGVASLLHVLRMRWLRAAAGALR